MTTRWPIPSWVRPYLGPLYETATAQPPAPTRMADRVEVVSSTRIAGTEADLFGVTRYEMA